MSSVDNRKLHYWTAGIAFFFLLITTITGILWAYAPYMYWESGYKEKQNKSQSISMDDISKAITLPKMFEYTQLCTEKDTKVMSFSLVREVNSLFYRINSIDSDGGKDNTLINAINGKCLSPLPKNLAIAFARQYVPTETLLIDANLLDNWIHRKKSKGRLAWRIQFNDSGKTEIFIDPYHGVILEDQNTARRFHWWIMKLHQFNFFGTHKILSIISGVPLLIILFSGGFMLWVRIKRKYQRNGSKKANVLMKNKE
ncbi:MAG: hypothetical protein A6F72_00080 [Cycloclasticus sp. symbiont of Poecilosclerida sp. N]|nr:MAG: hypothetical protein A6F72_00080 [Cycloclasticus sp. symbiont of Poecilosclerida sp. N]